LRAEAWEMYLGDLLMDAFIEARGTTLSELLGTQIVDLIRSHANIMNLSIEFQGVDAVMREIREAKQNRAPHPKSGKVAAARSKASRPTDT